MAGFDFQFNGLAMTALPSRALLCRDESTLIAADLHLGRALRSSLNGGAALPPFEVIDTLARLQSDIDSYAPRRVVLLGDSYDTPAAIADMPPEAAAALHRIGAQTDLVFVSGNHDPEEGDAEAELAGISLRHIAGIGPDISGHYHPKLRLAGQSFPVFLLSDQHLILPAYGTFTGGLFCTDPVLRKLVPDGIAIVVGPHPNFSGAFRLERAFGRNEDVG